MDLYSLLLEGVPVVDIDHWDFNGNDRVIYRTSYGHWALATATGVTLDPVGTKFRTDRLDTGDARVAELEACLADVCRQLEMGGETK